MGSRYLSWILHGTSSVSPPRNLDLSRNRLPSHKTLSWRDPSGIWLPLPLGCTFQRLIILYRLSRSHNVAWSPFGMRGRLALSGQIWIPWPWYALRTLQPSKGAPGTPRGFLNTYFPLLDTILVRFGQFSRNLFHFSKNTSFLRHVVSWSPRFLGIFGPVFNVRAMSNRYCDPLDKKPPDSRRGWRFGLTDIRTDGIDDPINTHDSLSDAGQTNFASPDWYKKCGGQKT